MPFPRNGDAPPEDRRLAKGVPTKSVLTVVFLRERNRGAGQYSSAARQGLNVRNIRSRSASFCWFLVSPQVDSGWENAKNTVHLT